MSYLVQTLNGNVYKHHIGHVKIGSDDSAVEVTKEIEHCDQPSSEIFLEEVQNSVYYL